MGNVQKLKVYLDTSVISYLKQDDACFELAKEIIDKGILPSKSIDDSYHIATAKGYKSINILNPLTLLEMEV